MDVIDQSSAQYEVIEAAQIRNTRRQSHPVLARRHEQIAEARAIAAQRGPNDPEVKAISMECLNGCGEQLELASDVDALFCCKECAEDWEGRERVRNITKNRN